MRGADGCQEYSPLRRRKFCGGCSWVEYQQIAAAGFFPVPSTDALWVSWNGAGTGKGGLVFGTLLGPEATGPGLFPGLVFLVSWLHRSYGWSLCGGSCGVCGMGLLFENYIVDASIFYKKQFPRI